MGIPRIIGVTGYAQHGKDTLAEVLVRELGYSRVALADQMKASLYALNPIIPHGNGPLLDRLADMVDSVGWDQAKQEPEVRGLLQRFGTEVGRNLLGEDVWIGALAKATPGLYGDRKVVIPDIRFPNEAEWVRRMHGQVWLVQRLDFDNGIGIDHPSEREIATLRTDRVYLNDGSKAAFKESVYRDLKFQMALVQAQEDYRPALDQLAER